MRALITGAAMGIGKAISAKLIKSAVDLGEPIELLMVDLNADSLGMAATEMQANGARVVARCVDMADPHVPAALVGEAIDAFGGLDLVASNAGCSVKAPLSQTSAEDWDRVFAVNVRASWLLATAAHLTLKASGGSIVFTTSISGSQPSVAFGPYSASKAALTMLMRTLAVEFGADGIRVNAVSPGLTDTAQMASLTADPLKHNQIASGIPMGRIGAPDDIANAVAFLSSRDAAFITGTELVVDGGLTNALMHNFTGRKLWQ